MLIKTTRRSAGTPQPVQQVAKPVSLATHHGAVLLRFPENVEIVELTPANARELGEALLAAADNIQRPRLVRR